MNCRISCQIAARSDTGRARSLPSVFALCTAIWFSPCCDNRCICIGPLSSRVQSGALSQPQSESVSRTSSAFGDTLARRQKRREASAAVVEILAEWSSHSSYLGREQTNEERWKLQITYWRNILLLDKALIGLLLPRLANAPNAADTNELIVQARKILLELNTQT